MVNLRRLLTMLLFMLAVACVANAQSFERQGNTFVSTSARSNKTPDEQTKFTWKDNKGREYPVFISSRGSCYVIKKSGISVSICFDAVPIVLFEPFDDAAL